MNENLFKGYLPLQHNTFLLIVEDEKCDKSIKALKEFEEVILEKFERHEEEFEKS